MDSDCTSNFVQMMEMEEPVEKEKIEAISSGTSAAENPSKEALSLIDTGVSLSVEKEVELTLKHDIVHCDDVSPVKDDMQSMTNLRNPVQNTLSNMIWVYEDFGNNGNDSDSTHDISDSSGNKAEQVTVKENSHMTNDSSSELEVSDHNLSLTGGKPSSSGDITKTTNFSDGLDDVIKTEDNYEEDYCDAVNGSSSDVIGGPSVSESQMNHNGTPEASPKLEVSRKRKRETAINGTANLFAPREKRSAFKKCTEWFKVLTGEMQASHFCTLCGASFSSTRELKTHKLIHDVKKKEPGEVYEPHLRAFEPYNEMTERLEYNDGKYFQCKECNERFSSKSGLTRHQAKHSRLTMHHCELCDQAFSTKARLQAHVHTHSDSSKAYRQKVRMLRTPVSRVRKYKCDQCDARFTQQWSLDQHHVIHSRAETHFECKECKERFADITLLVKHQESHSYQKLFQCGDCNERFSHKSSLYKHQLTHVNQRKVECSECEATFAERSQLKIHFFSVHGTENMCVCSQCNKFFSKQASLKRHLLMSHNDRAFKCTVCNETFAQKSTLNRHSVLHAGEQFYRFVCSVCNRKFSRRETLNDHVRTHTGEKPFSCEVCHEGFSQKSAMKRHQILHFKERRGKGSVHHVDMDTGATEDILLSLVYTDS